MIYGVEPRGDGDHDGRDGQGIEELKSTLQLSYVPT